MPRFKPTIGIVGYDFGYKPAFSVAMVPKLAEWKQQGDEYDPPRFCHDLIGNFLDAIVSGVTPCTFCFTHAGQDYSVTFTPVNGSYTTTYDAGYFLGPSWVDTIGTITVSAYNSADGTCTDLLSDATGDADIIIQCEGENVLRSFIRNNSTIGPFSFVINIFSSAGGGALDAAMANVNVCGWDNALLIAVVGENGNITASIP